jgi:hypothetical protein
MESIHRGNEPVMRKIFLALIMVIVASESIAWSGNQGATGIAGLTWEESTLLIDGLVNTTGTEAGFQISRRDTAAKVYSLYSAAGDFSIYSDSAIQDVLTLTSSGNLSIDGHFSSASSKIDISTPFNSAYGFASLSSITTGTSNTAIGFESLKSLNQGSCNIGIGASSLRATTTGANCVAIGFEALKSMGPASDCSAVGHQSQKNNSGSFNSSLGYQSLVSTTTGTNNTGIGWSALSSNNTGSDNTAVGSTALYVMSTGSQNMAVGRNAGRLVSGGTNNTSASNSVYLGYDSRPNASSELNEIVIGHTAIGAGSNTATLGNTSITSTILRGDVKIPSTTLGGLTANTTNTLVSLQCGTATLASGTANIPGVTITANSRIFLTQKTAGGTTGTRLQAPSASRSVGAGTGSFVIESVDTSGAVVTTDTSTVDWQIIN